MAEWFHTTVVEQGRLPALLLLLGYAVTFAVTRGITRAIRARAESGRSGGVVKDVHVGGVHVHHQVWGILLALAVGLVEFRFRPGEPWVGVLALLFGAGAALALDEFALWLHLDDVYWTAEGRASLDAVMIALVVGAALLVGTSPLGIGSPSEQQGAAGVSVVLGFHILTTVLCLLKGKVAMGLVGLLVPALSLVGALRLAHPESFWARRWYGEPRTERARARHQRLLSRRARWQALVGGRIG